MSEKNQIAFSQEPRLDNSQIQNRESERLIDKKRHHGVKRFNIGRNKTSLSKNLGSLEDHRQKVKTQEGLESQIKRLRQQAGILKRNIKNDSDETEKARQLGLQKKS